SVQLQPPQKPVISSVTGTWLKDDQATDRSYWTEHIKNTVRFADVLETINTLGTTIFIEVGPGKVTSSLARQALGREKHAIVTSLEMASEQAELTSLLKAVGTVWLHGAEPNWKAIYGGKEIDKLNLPNYAFDKKRCWVDPPSFLSTTTVRSEEHTSELQSRENLVCRLLLEKAK